MQILSVIAAAVAAACALSPALCAADDAPRQPPTAQAEQAGDIHALHGVVNSVNAAASRVNITHDPVESLKWPRMKMNFKAQDPAILQGLQPGTVVDFEIRKVEDQFVITRITPVK
jgi:Cu/Ag efflux protein CusF